jgi:hypothetical protein
MALLSVLLLVVVVALVLAGSMGTGSNWRASVWRERLASIKSVEEARQRFPELEVLQFGDGTWMVLASENSHANPLGGTIVARDSRGSMHAFFGHVCGESLVRSDTLGGAWNRLQQQYASSPDAWPAKEAERQQAARNRNAKVEATKRRE